MVTPCSIFAPGPIVTLLPITTPFPIVASGEIAELFEGSDAEVFEEVFSGTEVFKEVFVSGTEAFEEAFVSGAEVFGGVFGALSGRFMVIQPTDNMIIKSTRKININFFMLYHFHYFIEYV